jgi:MFS family permease
MPALGRSLGVTPLAVSWLLTAYLVAASVATPLIGRLGDLLGRGRVLTWVMLVFCAGSVMCALGDSLAVLVAGRVLQGVAGGVFPLAYGIIRDTFPSDTRMRAIGSLSVSLGVGAALGPAVAGIIVDHAGPSAIFWAGMLGAVPTLCAGRLLPELPGRSRTLIDWSGAAVLAGALTALLVLMTQGQQLGWTSSTALALLVAAAGLFGWWVTIEGRRPAPRFRGCRDRIAAGGTFTPRRGSAAAGPRARSAPCCAPEGRCRPPASRRRSARCRGR